MTPKITVLTSHVDISRSFSHNLTKNIIKYEKIERGEIGIKREEN